MLFLALLMFQAGSDCSYDAQLLVLPFTTSLLAAVTVVEAGHSSCQPLLAITGRRRGRGVASINCVEHEENAGIWHNRMVGHAGWSRPFRAWEWTGPMSAWGISP